MARTQKQVEVAGGISSFLRGLSGGIAEKRKGERALKLAETQKQPRAGAAVDARTAAAFLRSVGQDEQATRVEEEGLPQDLATLKLFQPALAPIVKGAIDPIKAQRDRELAAQRAAVEKTAKERTADIAAGELRRKNSNDALREVQDKFFSNLNVINENELIKQGTPQDIIDYNLAIKSARRDRGLDEGPDRIGTRKGKAGFLIEGGLFGGERPDEFFINPLPEEIEAPAAAPAAGQDQRLQGVQPAQLERARKILQGLDQMDPNDRRRPAWEAALAATKQGVQ